MKGLDVVMMALLRLSRRNDWTFAELSEILGQSVSQCHASRERLRAARLLSSNPQKPWHVPADNFSEYLVHGFKYDFPAKQGGPARGFATGQGSDFVASVFRRDAPGASIWVWPSPEGDAVGNSLEPVHASVLNLVSKPGNEEMYRLMVCLDLLRMGQARERKWAAESIREAAHAVAR